MKAIADRVINGYEDYLTDFPVLQGRGDSLIGLAEEEQRRALNGCYFNKTKSFKAIIEKIYNSQPNVLKGYCPYCMLGEPETIDHYIGKEEFPEYSILVKNMIPCCFDCNTLKRVNWRTGNNRNFIHYYNDLFLHNRFLYASLQYQVGSAVPLIDFYLQRPVGMNVSDFTIVENHFRALNLRKRYQGRSNSQFSTQTRSIQISLRSGVLNPAHYLNDLAVNSRIDFGVNFWEAALYEAMAHCPEFIRTL
ncbi:HNH endonuclease [Pseudoflavitalea rhizosphaerae]|uniref:HNH endonuclease n=1 Tax=Pseudoflavitalea rhizosphaerae TaxID=1884793 RepID=UPI000F8F5633|nr:hypothetical protein [Pseudoflavitalea rhizosphaerae]